MLAFVEHPDGGLGACRECALMTAVVPREREGRPAPRLDLLLRARRRDLGVHVLDLPVTTERSMAAGRELWALPKWVTAVEMDVGDGRVRCSVAASPGGERLLWVQGALGRGFRLPALDQVVYSARAGAALRMLMELRGPTTASRGVGLVVRVAGSSPMARHLAALGLDGASPLLVQACRRGQMVFHGAEPLGRARGG